VSRLARAITIGAVLAAMNLAGATAVAQTPRPPTEARVGEAWRHRHVAPAVAGHTLRPPTEGRVGEPWHPRASIPPRPADPTPHRDSPVAWLVGLAALLALAVLAMQRAGRNVRPGHAA
jgi:hypothetical protein